MLPHLKAGVVVVWEHGMMDSHLQQVVPLLKLEDAAKALCADPKIETRLFEVDGTAYVFKRDRAKPWASARACLAAMGCRVVFGEWVSPALLRTGGVRHEAARLRELGQAGRRVPAVLFQNDECLVLSCAGKSLDEIVEHVTLAEMLALFERVADDLADWHRHGDWHGGAQLRNVTEHPEGLYRIDFEERHGHVLSAAATRAYDMFLFFGDALSNLPPEEVLPSGCPLMQRYLEQVADPALIAMLQRMLRLLQPMVWVDRHWPRLTAKRDNQRIVRFAKVLRSVLPTLTA